jgi:NADH dehydrogenase
LPEKKHVVIVGAGFAGLNAARTLAKNKNLSILVIDRRNHHLFQPLLYQVAMAGLSPADIAAPIRTLLNDYKHISVIQGEVSEVDYQSRKVLGDFGEAEFDYLILACGATHSYFGNENWEQYAPGLKSLEQATEIRRRVLKAFESAEREKDPKKQKKQLTFVIVGGGPTGVELAGAIGEMSRYTLARDFRNIDPKATRIILVEAGDRILPMFERKMAQRAVRDLESLGVQVWTKSTVTDINAEGVTVGEEVIRAQTVLWAAGVQGAQLNQRLEQELDRAGRVKVEPDLSLKGRPEVFVLGDQACALDEEGNPLPGVAPVAMQQGRYVGKLILDEINGKERGKAFKYTDKGTMATIGRSRAIVQSGPMRVHGWLAWLMWLVVHIYYLSGFRNRIFVLLQWAWSYMTFKRGARLIVGKRWQYFSDDSKEKPDKKT